MVKELYNTNLRVSPYNFFIYVQFSLFTLKFLTLFLVHQLKIALCLRVYKMERLSDISSHKSQQCPQHIQCYIKSSNWNQIKTFNYTDVKDSK